MKTKIVTHFQGVVILWSENNFGISGSLLRGREIQYLPYVEFILYESLYYLLFTISWPQYKLRLMIQLLLEFKKKKYTLFTIEKLSFFVYYWPKIYE